MGNRLEVELKGSAKVHLKIQQYQSQTSCLFTELSDWLTKHRAHFDYDSKALYIAWRQQENHSKLCEYQQEEVQN